MLIHYQDYLEFRWNIFLFVHHVAQNKHESRTEKTKFLTLRIKVNSVQDACAKHFAVPILKFEICIANHNP